MMAKCTDNIQFNHANIICAVEYKSASMHNNLNKTAHTMVFRKCFLVKIH